MQGLPFNSTEFLGQYACEIKDIEKRIYAEHKDEIVAFLALIRDEVTRSSHNEKFEYMSHGSKKYRNAPDIREIEQMARDILDSMEAELKQAVTKKYVLTQRPEDEKPDAPKSKSVCDRLKGWLP